MLATNTEESENAQPYQHLKPLLVARCSLEESYEAPRNKRSVKSGRHKEASIVKTRTRCEILWLVARGLQGFETKKADTGLKVQGYGHRSQFSRQS